jgi:prevent-host-death family protein
MPELDFSKNSCLSEKMTTMTIFKKEMVMSVELLDRWTVAQAKARLSEVIDKARHSGPQEITRNGKRAVVVVDVALWERMGQREQRGSFADFLLISPLHGSGLEAERLKGGLREAEL